MFTADEIRQAPKGKRTEMIRENITTGPWIWVARALVVLHDRQTADERSSQSTTHENGVGFNGTDARFLSSLAEQVRAWEGTPPEGRRFPVPLSARQLELARKKVAKYAKQLADEVERRRAQA